MNVTPDLLSKVTTGMSALLPGPSEADISSICEISGVDRAQAIILLKKWPGWQDAVTHYFEDPAGSLREATESRQWETPDNMPPSFRVDIDETGIMSRPPSPAGQYIDLTDAHRQGKSFRWSETRLTDPATAQLDNERQKEDADLNRAMAESMRHTQGQESGTIGQGQHFGPATRQEYDMSNWAVTALASAREVVDHPPPSKRRRIMGGPAFLRGSPDTGYDAALLTIYHSIPLAREALLFPPLRVYEYGHNVDWWSGTTDENAKALSMEHTTTGAEDRRRYLAEIQCLMGFLDNSTRAYGSVDALNDLRYSRHFQPENGLTKFLEVWQQAAMQEQPDEPLTQIFTTKAVQATDPVGTDPEEKALFLIEGPVRNALSQAELLDKIVWIDGPTQPLQDVWLEELGHVVTMRCFNDEIDATKLDLLVSEVWYLDRYTPAMKETLRNLRQRCLNLLRERDMLTHARDRLTETPKRPNAPARNINKVLEAMKQAIPVAMAGIDTDPTNVSDPAILQAQVDRIVDHIADSISNLQRSQTRIEQQVRTIMSDITDPATSTQPLRHKYYLQGVATKPSIMYVRQFNRDLIGMDDESDGVHEAYQWWRMAWEKPTPLQEHDDQPYSIQKVSFQDVVDAAKNEHHTAVLVYADEIAMSFAKTPLSAAMRQFVERDNRSFEDEISLNQYSAARRSRSWSNETNSTAVIDENDPFDDRMALNHVRNGTPMSTSTMPSDDEGPSPKRPKSSDDSLVNRDALPPAYEEAIQEPRPQSQQHKGNKIGYFAEKLLNQVDEQQKGG